MNTAYISWKARGKAEVLKNVLTHSCVDNTIFISCETGPRTEENNYCLEYDTIYIPTNRVDWVRVESRNDDI